MMNQLCRSLCDAVIDTYGNDNIRDLLQPISLDAISTPGHYWFNPPTPRDDFLVKRVVKVYKKMKEARM